LGPFNRSQHRLHASGLKLAAVRQQDQLRGRRAPVTHERRQTGERVDRARDRHQRSHQLRTGLLEASSDLDFAGWGEKRSYADLLQVHPNQVDVAALNALLIRLARQLVGCKPIRVFLWHDLSLERFGFLHGEQLVWRAVEGLRILVALFVRPTFEAECSGAFVPIEYVQLWGGFLPLHQRLRRWFFVSSWHGSLGCLESSFLRTPETWKEFSSRTPDAWKVLVTIVGRTHARNHGTSRGPDAERLVGSR
jgi:hypothetical protein